MANYPTSIFNYAANAQVDGTDTVNAADVNKAYDEISAIETNVGTAPKSRVNSWGTGTFSTASTTYDSLAARVENAENGVYTVNSNYVTRQGGAEITPSAANVVGLTLTPAVSQSAVLLSANGHDIINSAGYLVIDGGTA